MARYIPEKVHGVKGRYKVDTELKEIKVIPQDNLDEEDMVSLSWNTLEGYPNELETTLERFADFRASLPKAVKIQDLVGLPVTVFYSWLQFDPLAGKYRQLKDPVFDGIVARF